MNESFTNSSALTDYNALNTSDAQSANFIPFDESSYSIYESISLAIFLILLDFLTIMGNSFVILAVMFDLNLRSPTHYLMGSLASADLLIGLLILPFSSFQMYFNNWPFGNAFCTIWKSMYHFDSHKFTLIVVKITLFIFIFCLSQTHLPQKSLALDLAFLVIDEGFVCFG